MDVINIAEKKPRKKRGRPATGRKQHYTVRFGVDVCDKIAMGQTLATALTGTGGPTMPTFWRWMDEYPELRAKYDMARQMQADIHADRILEMAAEVLQAPSKAPAFKVAADILRWQAEIRDPKKYGTKVQHELKAPPLKPEDLKSEIARLEEELGVVSAAPSATAPRPKPKVQAEVRLPDPPPTLEIAALIHSLPKDMQ